MEAAQQNFVSESGQTCAALLDEIYSKLVQFNTLYNGTPNYDALIDAAAIATVSSFVGAGLTKQHLDDAQFALATIKATIEGALPAFSVMANLP